MDIKVCHTELVPDLNKADKKEDLFIYLFIRRSPKSACSCEPFDFMKACFFRLDFPIGFPFYCAIGNMKVLLALVLLFVRDFFQK